MPDIHELLDEAQQHCETLTREIATHKSSRRVNEELATSLSKTVSLLERTVREIRPIREAAVRRNTILLLSGVGAAVLLSLANLIITLLGG